MDNGSDCIWVVASLWLVDQSFKISIIVSSITNLSIGLISDSVSLLSNNLNLVLIVGNCVS